MAANFRLTEIHIRYAIKKRFFFFVNYHSLNDQYQGVLTDKENAKY